ncbi:MAG TPA: tetratricopeptide repeat protein [Melioribacteraceae bacterium]|nr:tetratricopeptide repeat protein [Melioribacteraceae bacterium]
MILNPVIYKCPYCNKLYDYIELISGNTFGAVSYSDGFIMAPMLPNIIRITKCINCNSFFWLNDFNLYTAGTLNSALQQLPELTIYDYMEYLDNNYQIDLTDELYIRNQIRFNFNHSIKLQSDEFALVLAERNLMALLDIYLYKLDTVSFLNIGEIYRNLGQFEKAIEYFNKYLKNAKKEEHEVLSKLLNLSKQKIKDVVII